MAAKVILAVAGSGKTYALSRCIPRGKKALIIAFTHQNVRNIVAELAKSWKERFDAPVPETVQVMTFDSFVYRYLVSPYIKTIADHFKVESNSFGDVSLKDPPVVTRISYGRSFTSPKYNKKKLLHYIDATGNFYVSKLTELVLYIGTGKESLVAKCAANLDKFWDLICVDEFQDFREHDYDLIKELMVRCKDMILVGDYYQHSVSAKGNTGRPYEKQGKAVSYSDFIDSLRNKKIDVDTTSLSASRRCPRRVCEFVNKVMGIPIKSASDREGCVSVVTEANVDEIMADDAIVKLHYDGGRNKPYRANNWSYSKGDTYKNACVILTKSTDSFARGERPEKMSEIVRNKLYVALTRATDNLYLMTPEIYKSWESRNS